jgi:transposase
MSNLSPKKVKVIAALLAGKSQAAAAQHAGVAERTVHHWVVDPDFKAEYDRQRTLLAEQALASLQGLATEAVETLRSLLQSERESVRLRTACYILDRAAAHIEVAELQARVARLEDMSEDELRSLIARLERK